MNQLFRVLMVLILSLNVWACTTTQTREELNIERSNVISMTATVEAIDMANRMITLRGPEGNVKTVHAGQEVVNLPQVRVGDEVELDYLQAIAVRMAKPGEVRQEETGMIEAAEPGSKPGMFGATETMVTATILDLDRVNETATLKGPDGEIIVVEVQDPTNFDKVKVGETIVITYTEAIAVSVQGKKE